MISSEWFSEDFDSYDKNFISWLKITKYEWFNSENGKNFIYSKTFPDYLDKKGSSGIREWLTLKSGIQWLESDIGVKWFETKNTLEEIFVSNNLIYNFMFTEYCKKWIESDKGRKWFDNTDGKWLVRLELTVNSSGKITENYKCEPKYIDVKKWIFTDIGKRWIESVKGYEWMLNKFGSLWLICDNHIEFIFNTQSDIIFNKNFDKILRSTNYGVLLKDFMIEFLKSQRGILFLKSQNGTSFGRWFELYSLSPEYRNWVLTDGGNLWLINNMKENIMSIINNDDNITQELPGQIAVNGIVIKN